MAGIKSDTPIPTDIKLHQKSRFVELFYENGERYELDFEFLRVFTPSAEARLFRWTRQRPLLLGSPLQPRQTS